MTGTRFPVLLACCLVGCSPATRPAAHAAPHSPAPRARWRQYSLPLTGIRARFPESPNEAVGDTQQKGTTLHYSGFSLEKKGTTFLCMLVDMKTRTDDKIALANAVKFLGPGVHKVHSLVDNGFRGVDAAGKDKDGANVVRRFVVVGDGMLLAGVTDPHHAIDPSVAKRFVEGCRVDVPWRIAPWVEEGMTVSVPADAIETNSDDPKTKTKTVMYYLGGVDELAFIVAASRLDPRVLAYPQAADAVLDHAAAGMQSSGYKIQFTSAVDHDGVHGRELLMTKKHQLRWRMFIVGDHLYQLGVIADRASALREAAALRFFHSVTWRGR